MTSWQIVRLVAGSLILVSLMLGMPGSPLYAGSAWLGLAAFVGLNLLQSAVTRWCPLEILLRCWGVRRGC